MTTEYHSQYWATALTVNGKIGTLESLSRSISNARVDLNPHQVEAALFAMRSPLSKGVILGDEVGLGKTVEAGLVIAQYWAARHRKILLVMPATLRKQWQQEMEEKFSIPSVILEGPTFKAMQKAGQHNPLRQQDKLVICSYHFASAKADEIRLAGFDLVVIDEAHRMRNVYKTDNKMAKRISSAVQDATKLLLTATPLQNSLLELYGLTSVIDPHIFGDRRSFQQQFVRNNDENLRNATLRQRLRPVLNRTLRSQVLEYIRYTKRIPVTQDFTPTDDEQAVYDRVSAYLQRDRLIALPNAQRQLMTLVLRKLLASSSFAISGTLRGFVDRLEAKKDALEALQEEFDGLGELQDEWVDDDLYEELRTIDPVELENELAELREYADLASRIQTNAKGDALLAGLEKAFEQTSELGAKRKAVIFTESRRTQNYICELLAENGYDGEIVQINGSNNDPGSKAVYKAWLERHAGSDKISGSKTADMKAAIVEEFRDRATILVATESAAEGVNLQFCSLLINYDLPWNPQRIEQRIGRCHRYGQEHDVVVVNFLNRRNAADRRVFQLLNEKFNLFSGVFGSSDEVLGALESGVDLEKRIAELYQTCRTSGEIETAFDALQSELEDQIQTKMQDAKKALLDNFDDEVSARFKVHRDQAVANLNERQKWLLNLAKFELSEAATFDPEQPRFEYHGDVADGGIYDFRWPLADADRAHFFRQDHPLAENAIRASLERDLPPTHLTFNYSNYNAVISALDGLVGKSGWMSLTKMSVTSVETEEFAIFSAVSDDGTVLDDDLCQKLFAIPAQANGDVDHGAGTVMLQSVKNARIGELREEIEIRNADYFDEEITKLDSWADDMKFGLEQEIKDLDKEIRETRKQAGLVQTLSDKLECRKQVKALEDKRNRKRKELFEAQDSIDEKRNGLIEAVERQLQSSYDEITIFTVRWEIV